jgi:hypothetical protein
MLPNCRSSPLSHGISLGMKTRSREKETKNLLRHPLRCVTEYDGWH